MFIFIETLEGHRYRVEIEPADTVKAVKEKIATTLGIAAEKQRLISNGKELSDDNLGVWGGYNIRQDSVIKLEEIKVEEIKAMQATVWFGNQKYSSEAQRFIVDIVPGKTTVGELKKKIKESHGVDATGGSICKQYSIATIEDGYVLTEECVKGGLALDAICIEINGVEKLYPFKVGELFCDFKKRNFSAKEIAAMDFCHKDSGDSRTIIRDSEWLLRGTTIQKIVARVERIVVEPPKVDDKDTTKVNDTKQFKFIMAALGVFCVSGGYTWKAYSSTGISSIKSIFKGLQVGLCGAAAVLILSSLYGRDTRDASNDERTV